MPLKIEDGYYTSKVGASTPLVDEREIGFWEGSLKEISDGLEDGQWVIMDVNQAAGRARYRRKIGSYTLPEVEYGLTKKERENFRDGYALLFGRYDHRGEQYSPWDIDDRIRRENISNSGTIEPGEQIFIRPICSHDEEVVSTFGDHPLARFKEPYHEVQYI